MTFYSDFVPKGHGAWALGPLVFIRPKYKDDKGILAHEELHVQQWAACCLLFLIPFSAVGYATGIHFELASLFMFWAIYLIPSFRLRVEVAAYREQAKYYPDDRMPLFAGFIATRYGLKVTEAKALKLLKGE
jgi:hypothetical protein